MNLLILLPCCGNNGNFIPNPWQYRSLFSSLIFYFLFISYMISFSEEESVYDL